MIPDRTDDIERPDDADFLRAIGWTVTPQGGSQFTAISPYSTNGGPSIRLAYDSLMGCDAWSIYHGNDLITCQETRRQLRYTCRGLMIPLADETSDANPAAHDLEWLKTAGFAITGNPSSAPWEWKAVSPANPVGARLVYDGVQHRWEFDDPQQQLNDLLNRGSISQLFSQRDLLTIAEHYQIPLNLHVK